MDEYKILILMWLKTSINKIIFLAITSIQNFYSLTREYKWDGERERFREKSKSKREIKLNNIEKEAGTKMNERAESNRRKVSELKDPGRCVQKCLQNVETYAASRSGPKEFAINGI